MEVEPSISKRTAMVNAKRLIFVLLVSSTLAGCESLISGWIDPEGTRKELLRNHQDPTLILQKVEQERANKNAEDIERSNQKEETAKNKILNDLIDKSLGR